MELSQFLAKINFATVDDDNYSNLWDGLQEKVKNQVNEAGLLAGIGCVQRMLVVKPAPSAGSRGTALAEKVVERLCEQATESQLMENPAVRKALWETFVNGVKPPLSTYRLRILRNLNYNFSLNDSVKTVEISFIQRLLDGLQSSFPLPAMDEDEEDEFEREFNNVFRHGIFECISPEQATSARKPFQDLYYLCMKCTFTKFDNRCLCELRSKIERIFDNLPKAENGIFAKVENEQVIEKHLLLMRELVLHRDFIVTEDAFHPVKYYGSYILQAFKNDERVRKKHQKLLIKTTFELWFRGHVKMKEFCCEFIGRWAWEKHCDLKGDDEAVTECVTNVIRIVNAATTDEIVDLKLGEVILKNLVMRVLVPAWNAKHATIAADLLMATVRKCNEQMVECAVELAKNGRVLKWKDMPQKAVEYFNLFLSIDPNQLDTTGWAVTRTVDCFYELIVTIRKINAVMKLVYEPMGRLFLKAVNEPQHEYWGRLAYCCFDDIDIMNLSPIFKEFLKSTNKVIQLDDYLEEEKLWVQRTVSFAMTGMVGKLCAKNAMGEYAAEFKAILNTLVNLDILDDRGNLNPYGTLLQSLLNIGQTTKEKAAFGMVLPATLKCLTMDEERIRQTAASVFTSAVMNFKDEMTPHLAVLLDSYFEHAHTGWGHVISSIYPGNPDVVHCKLAAIMDMIDSGDSHRSIDIILILTPVAKLHPEAISESQWNQLLSRLDNQSEQMMLLNLISSACDKMPGYFVPRVNQFLQLIDTAPLSLYAITNILANIGVIAQMPVGKQIVNDLYRRVATVEQMNRYYLVNVIYRVGSKHRPLLEEKKAMFERYVEDPQLCDLCKAALDIIAGRTAAELDERVHKQGDEIGALDERTTKTEKNVTVLDDKSKKLSANVKDLKKDVSAVRMELRELAERVAQMEFKLSDVDKQMMSMAPSWVPAVSEKLAKREWRLLAERLGYTQGDVDVLQGGPRALLTHWMCCQPPASAAELLRQQLDELAWTVERDMVIRPNIIPDPEPKREKPTVFLSYQWAHQPQVKMLWKHLLAAGYHCWMDVGQMGGGDKLFAKLDDGIRSAKVVVSCVTPLYARSANCTREVNLSISLNKPIIPLLIEQMPWPPAGAMGPVMSEYLFVRFFQRDNERTGDERYWPAAKFDELLMQVRYHAPPDRAVAKASYWQWSPSEQAQSKAVTTTKPAAAASGPSSGKVFLSYQWDHQPQVKALRDRLMGLGLTCWMDIFEMGGGDSLYEKIDSGLREAAVVVSCVSEKYAASMNCRREVSLADALKKPIIPMIVDDKCPWPPAGPMSPVLTQLKPIRVNNAVQQKWPMDAAEVKELLERIRPHFPEMSTSSPSKTARTKAKSPTTDDEAPQPVASKSCQIL